MPYAKAKREIANKNIRIYPSSLKLLQELAERDGRTIAGALRVLLDATSLAHLKQMEAEK